MDELSSDASNASYRAQDSWGLNIQLQYSKWPKWKGKQHLSPDSWGPLCKDKPDTFSEYIILSTETWTNCLPVSSHCERTFLGRAASVIVLQTKSNTESSFTSTALQREVWAWDNPHTQEFNQNPRGQPVGLRGQPPGMEQWSRGSSSAGVPSPRMLTSSQDFSWTL